MKRADRQVSVREWVDSNLFDSGATPEKSYERTRVLHRDANELLDGCTVTELDINLDTAPMELLDFMK